MLQGNTYYATGKRKTAIAKTWIRPGSGSLRVNDKTAEDYFRLDSACRMVRRPLELTNHQDTFDIDIKVLGGGILGQAGAARHGITRALIEFDPDLRSTLKRAGMVRRDPRAKERKKYGQRGARARFQFSKR